MSSLSHKVSYLVLCSICNLSGWMQHRYVNMLWKHVNETKSDSIHENHFKTAKQLQLITRRVQQCPGGLCYRLIENILYKSNPACNSQSRQDYRWMPNWNVQKHMPVDSQQHKNTHSQVGQQEATRAKCTVARHYDWDMAWHGMKPWIMNGSIMWRSRNARHVMDHIMDMAWLV